MGENSKIEWTDHTFNPWRGCQKVSPGCAHCYAETLSKRNPAVLGEWGPDGVRVIGTDAYWEQPYRWNNAALRDGVRRRVFCLSLGDWLEDRAELVEPLALLMKVIHGTPQLDWLLLTKRPELWDRRLTLVAAHRSVRMDQDIDDGAELAFQWLHGSAMPNVWLGVSVEDQQHADERIPLLLQTPAEVRFLSCEPLLGPVDLTKPLQVGRCKSRGGGSASTGPLRCGLPEGHDDHHSALIPSSAPWMGAGPGIDWVISGGESGPGARPAHPDWFRSIRDQCHGAGVPFFFKQWGEFRPATQAEVDDLDSGGTLVDKTTECGYYCDESVGHVDHQAALMARVGKRDAGRLLDGREWSEFPNTERTP